MDNVTHTLISIVVGEALHRSIRPSTVLSDRARRTVALTVMAVGGNLPDIDVAYTGWAGTTMDYLLHHRGHTHTILGALGLSALLFLAVRLWWRFRKVKPSRADLLFVAGVAVLAPLLHIALDFTNSYGVHPLWPVDNHWYYGDAVFIIEPALWASAAVLLFVLPSRVIRGLIAFLLLAGLAAAWFTGFVPVSFALMLTALTVGLAAVSRFCPPRVAVASGIAAWLLVTAAFVGTSWTARGDIETALTRSFPTARTLDTVLTPMPVNPVCREVLAVQVEQDRYVVRRVFHSLAPGWVPASRCATLVRRGTETTAQLTPVARADTDELVWAGELSMPAGLLAGIGGESCAAKALLQFARVPTATAKGDGWIIGDLRYDMEPGLGLTEIETGQGHDQCPRLTAPWIPPRHDLLHGD
ncbi:metal-dependent hydrolase [Longispora urticae]